jgi:hypothetical protein
VTDTPTLLPRLLTVKEFAGLYRVDVRTVQRWVRQRAVTVVQIGPRKCLRIVLDEPQPVATTHDK